MEYITALTALNIPMLGRLAPDWHSQVRKLVTFTFGLNRF